MSSQACGFALMAAGGEREQDYIDMVRMGRE
jgi:hypothetical protein